MPRVFGNKEATPNIIDIRDLASKAQEAYEMLVSKTVNDGDKQEARDILNILGESLKEFSNDKRFAAFEPDEEEGSSPDEDIFGKDIPNLLMKIGDNFDVNLVHDNYVADYLDDKAVELGWLTDETPSIIHSSIDWQRVADEYINDCVSFVIEGEIYWINK